MLSPTTSCGNDGSVAEVGRSFADLDVRSPARAGRTAAGVPVFAYARTPGVPPVAVVRLTQDDPGSVRGPGTHAHEFLVLLYAHRADGNLILDGRAWTVADGDVFVIAPGQVVSGGASGHAMGEAWVIAFPADVLRETAPGVLASWRTHPLLSPFSGTATVRTQRLRVPPEQRPAWSARCVALDTELRARRDGYHDAALAHLTLLLVEITRLSADLGGDLRAAEEPLLAAVFDVIEARFPEGISLADVAAELRLSAGHLTTVVRRRTGRTVQQWITERRMQAARRLLVDTDLPIAVLGHRVGYRDASYFIRRFRAEHGMTPLQWRHAGRESSSGP
jgi:AraC family transcriptional activator of pobA